MRSAARRANVSTGARSAVAWSSSPRFRAAVAAYTWVRASSSERSAGVERGVREDSGQVPGGAGELAAGRGAVQTREAGHGGVTGGQCVAQHRARRGAQVGVSEGVGAGGRVVGGLPGGRVEQRRPARRVPLAADTPRRRSRRCGCAACVATALARSPLPVSSTRSVTHLAVQRRGCQVRPGWPQPGSLHEWPAEGVRRTPLRRPHALRRRTRPRSVPAADRSRPQIASPWCASW